MLLSQLGCVVLQLVFDWTGLSNRLDAVLLLAKDVKAPRREFNPRGAYRVFRHPVYLSFLGLVWFRPDMTLDHAVLTGVWTGYIFYGSTLKDRRLVHYLGTSTANTPATFQAIRW